MFGDVTYDKSVVFFLGAGFSSPLNMPATMELKSVLERHLPDDLKGTYSLLEGFLKKTYGEQEVDIEKVYTFVNDLLLLSEDEVPFEISKNPEHVFMLGYLVKINENIRDTLKRISEIIMRVIEEEFWSRRLFELDRISQIFQDGILEDMPPTSISILTTNYDLAIEEYFSRHRKSIKLERGIQDGVFEPERLLNPEHDAITLCKLHGSIDLYKTVEGEIIHHNGPRSTFSGYEEISHMYITAPIENRSEYEKIDEPLRQKLAKDLNFADLLIVIGFSFRDPTIRYGIKGWTMKRPMMMAACGENTERVLDRSDDNIDESFSNRFRIVPHRFPSDDLVTGIEECFKEAILDTRDLEG